MIPQVDHTEDFSLISNPEHIFVVWVSIFSSGRIEHYISNVTVVEGFSEGKSFVIEVLAYFWQFPGRLVTLLSDFDLLQY